jgi:hypothetical protein
MDSRCIIQPECRHWLRGKHACEGDRVPLNRITAISTEYAASPLRLRAIGNVGALRAIAIATDGRAPYEDRADDFG